MKFGGSSVADAERIRGVAGIVRERLDHRPVVVISAIGGVTDLLEKAFTTACRGDLEALEPLLAELERRHRWAMASAVEDADLRHDLRLEVDGLFESLRGKLRSIRILGEGTPRARDGVLALGEVLSTRIIVAALRDCGIRAVWIDPRRLMVTDDRFGSAQPDLEAVREACAAHLAGPLREAAVPVVGGFVGATPSGETTTLGRGGSDTSAAVLGLALSVDEIQIWTDVDGMMSADPRLVPEARTLSRLSFAEAANLAIYGARVLHPASIAPAVRERIPVRVQNSLRPEGQGTLVLDRAPADSSAPVAVTSRRGVRLVRVSSRGMRLDPGSFRSVLEACRELPLAPELFLAAGTTLTWVAPRESRLEALEQALAETADVEVLDQRALVGVVGSGLASTGPLRGRVLAELARFDPDLVTEDASKTIVLTVVHEDDLESVVHRLHRRFFEGSEVA